MTSAESATTEVAARLADRFDEDGLAYAFLVSARDMRLRTLEELVRRFIVG